EHRHKPSGSCEKVPWPHCTKLHPRGQARNPASSRGGCIRALSPTSPSPPSDGGEGQTRCRPRHTSHWLPPPIEPGAVSRCTQHTPTAHSGLHSTPLYSK